MTWYEPKPPTLPEGDDPSAQPTVPDALSLLPWMPLEGVMEQWASFGAVACEVEGLQAASAAFAALAQEREAMHTACSQLALRRNPDLSVEHLLRFYRQQAIVSLLSEAASQWYEAARVVSQIIEAPGRQEVERLPPGLALRSLLVLALAQRERVWDLAHRLLLAHVRAADVGQGTSAAAGEEPQL